jgi:hypothetical protein
MTWRSSGRGAGKEVTMSGEKTDAPGSRRRLLGGGAAFLAGGVIGGAARASSAAPPAAQAATPPLPWKWASIDPMEAGSRAYRYYFDPGG